MSENEVHKQPSERIYVQALQEFVTKVACPDGNKYWYDMRENLISTKTAVNFTDEGYGLIKVHTPNDADHILLRVCRNLLTYIVTRRLFGYDYVLY